MSSSPSSSSGDSSSSKERAGGKNTFKSGLTQITHKTIYDERLTRLSTPSVECTAPRSDHSDSITPHPDCLPDESNKSTNKWNQSSGDGKLKTAGSTVGVSKSVSCTTEWCMTPSDESNNKSKLGSKMMLSNSSASLLKAKNYLQLYCHNYNLNNHHRGSPQLQIAYGIDSEREHWDKKIEFLLAVIGFAVDLGNVWRFPYVCYRNGGGAFLVAYCIMLLFGGLPLFYLELALGQYFSSGCLTIWKRLCPIMKGLGYAICMIDIYMGMYYNTIIAWSLYYLYVSFESLVSFTLPWSECGHTWNSPNCQTLEQRRVISNGTLASNNTAVSPAEEYYLNHVLQINDSPGIDSIGPIRTPLAICLMLIFLVVYFSLWKGVKSSGKAVWVTALMPYVVIAVFLFRATTLEGASDGIRYYLSPDWAHLSSINVWIDAATQIFFSLGPGFGTLMALSSYNKFHNNCYRDAIITSSVNCLSSFIAGFVTFSILGFMSKKLNKHISTVVPDGPGLVFIVYPEAISTMYGSVFFSILFFIMLITLGLDSTFGGLEAMITGLCDNYPRVLRRNREVFVAVLIIIIYLCALPTTTKGGNYLINLLDQHGTALPVLFVVFTETIVICWFYGSEKFSHQIKEMLGAKPGRFWRVCWRWLSPAFLGFISIASLVTLKPLTLGNYHYPEWSSWLGWGITFSSLWFIPLYAIYHFLITPGDNWKIRLAKCFKPIPPMGHCSSIIDRGQDGIKPSASELNSHLNAVTLAEINAHSSTGVDKEFRFKNESNRKESMGDPV